MTVHTLPGALGETPDPVGPHNLEAEQAVLGALLFMPEAAQDAVAGMRPGVFTEPFHERLYSAILTALRTGRACDPVALATRFELDPAFKELGGLKYLADLVDRSPPVASVGGYVALLDDLATRRGLLSVAVAIGQMGRTGDVGGEHKGSDELLGAAEDQLRALADSGPRRDRWESAAAVTLAAIQDASTRAKGIEFPSGLNDFDSFLGGFRRQQTTIIAGRPGMAKSMVASQIAKANAQKGKGAAFFSQEMSGEDLGLRLACDLAFDRMAPMYSGVTTNPTFADAAKNALSPDQWAKLRRAQQQIADEAWALLLDTRPNLTLSQIEASSRRAIRRWEREGVDPGPIIIDHLGLIRPEKDRRGSKYEETADISNGLAAMAKRLDVPVVALCQLSRAVANREDKRPTLTDLRGAGELEQDARAVVMVYRPAYYYMPPEDGESETHEQRIERETMLRRVANKLFWIVAKNNNGPTGQVLTFIEPACSAIRDMEVAFD